MHGRLPILEELIKTAENLTLNKEFDQAIEAYTNIINVDPKDFVQSELNPILAKVYCLRGNIYLDRKQIEEAKVNYSQSIGLHPNAAAYNNRGLVDFEKENYDASILDYSYSIQLASDSICYYNRGRSYREKNLFEEALADYSHAISLGSKDVDLYISRGLVYIELKKYDEAIADYRRAICLNSSSDADKGINIPVINKLVEAYILRAEKSKQERNLKEAIEDFNFAYALDPKKSYQDQIKETSELLDLLKLVSKEKSGLKRKEIITEKAKKEDVEFLLKRSKKTNELMNSDLNFEQSQAYLQLSKYSEWILQGRQFTHEHAIDTNIFHNILSLLTRFSYQDSEKISEVLLKRIYVRQNNDILNKFSHSFFSYKEYHAAREEADTNYVKRSLR